MRITTPSLLALVSTLLLAAPAAIGQGKPTDAQRLDSLLKELDGVDAKVWQQRIKLLRDQVNSHKSRAQSLQRAAAESTRRAETVEREIKRLEQIQKFFLTGKPVTKKPVAKAKPATTKKPVAKKPVAKKPVVTKPVAKKPVTMKPAAKKPAVTKPVAKKPAVKKPAAKKPAAKKPNAKPKGTPKQSPPSGGSPMMSPSPSGTLVTYEDHIQEIFMDACAACHDSDDSKGGLDLSTFASTRAGGASGTTIIPGDVERSRLYLLVTHQEKPAMPKGEPKLGRDKLELIRRWIQAGAPESNADALAFAAKQKKAMKKVVAMAPRFDQPAAMPKGWPSVEPTYSDRPVTVTSLATSGRSPLLAVPGLRQVFVLDSTTRKQLGILPFTHGDVEVLRFSADCSQLLVGGGLRGKRGRVSLFDVAKGTLVGTYGKEFDSVLAAAIHPQLSHVALGGPKKRVQVFDLATGELSYEIRDHNDWILGLDFSPDGKFLASGSRDGSIVVARSEDGRNVHTIQRNRGAVQQVRFTPDSAGLAAIGDDKTLRMFELEDAKQLWSRNAGSQSKALAFSFDSKLLACGGSDGRARVFRRNGSLLATLPSVGDWIYSLAFDKDGKFLFVGNWQGVTHVFDIKTRKSIATLTPSAAPAIGTLTGQ